MGLEVEVDTKIYMTLAPICWLPIQFDTPELLWCVFVVLVWHLQ